MKDVKIAEEAAESLDGDERAIFDELSKYTEAMKELRYFRPEKLTVGLEGNDVSKYPENPEAAKITQYNNLAMLSMDMASVLRLHRKDRASPPWYLRHQIEAEGSVSIEDYMDSMLKTLIVMTLKKWKFPLDVAGQPSPVEPLLKLAQLAIQDTRDNPLKEDLQDQRKRAIKPR